MAANIPAALRPAGIAPFILRASQLESSKPVITYWCHYWVVNQILAKQLHNADQECLQFTTELMDKLEKSKKQHAENDAIHNDMAGQAYVEQFAEETFQRAMRTLKANQVTQQTASTFEASSTFMSLISIWGELDPEIQSKIKYAKWNAARILRAIKDGHNPNDSNPPQDQVEDETPPQADPELQSLSAQSPKPATVEDVPEDDASAQTSLRPASSAAYPARSPAPVSAPTSPPASSAPGPEPVSPIAPGDQAPQSSEGYFAGSLPSAPSVPDEMRIPSAASHDPAAPPPIIPSPSSHVPGTSPSAPMSPPAPAPQDYYRPTPPPPTQPSAPTPSFQPPPPVVPTMVPPSQPIQPAQPSAATVNPPVGSYTTDDMAMAQAQKHAKWAISALNFEDVPTAVRELQAALASLGAR